MKNIALLNMPFSNPGMPSIALTQLKCRVEEEFGDAVDVDVHYVSHDFIDCLGISSYQDVTNSLYSLNAGIGDWFFRAAAFPDVEDNSVEYFRRYFAMKDEQTERLKKLLVGKINEVGYFFELLLDKYKLADYDIVGFTSMFSQHAASLAMSRYIKARNPNVITVIGGANCDAPMGQEIIINVDSIDYVFSGPSLVSFPEFVGNVLKGDLKACESIRGVFHKNNATLMRGVAIQGDELDINSEVSVDFDPFVELMDKRHKDIEIILPLETSRGCWWGERAHCTFCGLNGASMKYRAMNAEKAKKLMRSLFKYSGKVSRLESVDNIIPQEYIEDVFKDLDTPSDMHFFYEVRANLNEDELQILSDARVKVIQPGIESLATSTLKHMKKGTTSFNNISFIKSCMKYDVFPAWNLLIGFPGERNDVYKKYLEDIPKLVHLSPPNGTFPVRFDRYSPYFKKTEEYGLKLAPLPFYEMIYPFPKESIYNMAYFFSDTNYHSEYIQHLVEYIVPLQKAVGEWNRLWDQDVQPYLYLDKTGGQDYVFDSRSGEEERVDISHLSTELLAALSLRKSDSELVSSFAGVSQGEIIDELEFLRKKGFLFEEKGRIMSLVMPHRTERFSHRLHENG